MENIIIIFKLILLQVNITMEPKLVNFQSIIGYVIVRSM